MSKLLSKTFLWMCVGLIVTFLTGYVVSTNENMLLAIFQNNLYWILFILEFILVIFFSARVNKMSPTTAKICFILYSFVNGLTFSSIFVLFEISSIIYVFLITALIFGIFGAIGYFTKIDLHGFGLYLLMALVGTIIATAINIIFLNSTSFDLILSIIFILIFIGLTAYDVQHVKELSESGVDNDVAAINGAFELYLDFINIFLHLIQIIGDAKD